MRHSKVKIATEESTIKKERNENYRNAVKELTRADHLIFVSLKYSRTVDVMLSIINRLIEAHYFAILAALETHYQDEDELKKQLHGAKTQTEGVVKAYPDLAEDIEFYKFLRNLNKAPIKQRLNEFRRHVTLVTEIDEKELRVKTDDIEIYYEKSKEFLRKVNKHIHSAGEDDLLSLKN